MYSVLNSMSNQIRSTLLFREGSGDTPEGVVRGKNEDREVSSTPMEEEKTTGGCRPKRSTKPLSYGLKKATRKKKESKVDLVDRHRVEENDRRSKKSCHWSQKDRAPRRA